MTESIRKQIIAAFNQGLTMDEIAKKYYVETSYINMILNQVKKEDINLYNKFLFLNTITKTEVDKDWLMIITDLIKQGRSLIEIAIILDKPIEKIKTYLSYYCHKSSPFYDDDYYNWLINKSRKNKANKQQVFKRLEILEKEYSLANVENDYIIRAYRDYQKKRQIIQTAADYDFKLNAVDLALKFGVDVDYVRKLLCPANKQVIILVLGQTGYLRFLKCQKEYLEINRKVYNKLHYSNDLIKPEDKVIISKLFQNELFWLEFICTFRLSVEDFAKVIGYTSDLSWLAQKLYILNSYCIGKENALKFLFNITSNNENSVANATNYLRLLKRAYLNHDEEKVDRYLSMIDDRRYLNIVKKGLKWNKLTLKEQLAVIKYKIKYAVSVVNIPYDRNLIKKSCPLEYQSLLESINSFNQSVGIEAYKYKARQK